MATFALIHGASDVGWYWHLVAAELEARSHRVVSPDLPCDDDAAGLAEYADTVVDAIDAIEALDATDAVDPGADRGPLVMVGQSFGGFTVPLVAERRPVDQLVLVAGMIPAPGERGADWFANTDWETDVQDQARRDGGLTGSQDPLVVFYHDVPRPLAEEAMSKERRQSSTPGRSPWPLDRWPSVPTRFVLCTEDRMFPPDFMRRVAADRLGIVPDEIAAGHCVALSRPKELADLLVGYAAGEENDG